MIIWRIVDDKPGHEHQSQGLISAIAKYTAVDCRDLGTLNPIFGILNFLLKKFPPGRDLPPPDLIISAGHATHLTALCAQHTYGGKTVIIMKPTLPSSWFDFCLIPAHDDPPTAANIIITQGAINTMAPGTQRKNRQGMIMIGGPSRHFHWDCAEMIGQIETIVRRTNDISWDITDSPRTPDVTRRALQQLKPENATFHSCKNTPPGWLREQLPQCETVWVTADSISMVYESLTAGAATGVLHVPAKKNNKVIRGISLLKKDGMITLYDDWRAGKKLAPPPVILNEADRCARELTRLLPRDGQVSA